MATKFNFYPILFIALFLRATLCMSADNPPGRSPPDLKDPKVDAELKQGEKLVAYATEASQQIAAVGPLATDLDPNQLAAAFLKIEKIIIASDGDRQSRATNVHFDDSRIRGNDLSSGMLKPENFSALRQIARAAIVIASATAPESAWKDIKASLGVRHVYAPKANSFDTWLRSGQKGIPEFFWWFTASDWVALYRIAYDPKIDSVQTFSILKWLMADHEGHRRARWTAIAGIVGSIPLRSTGSAWYQMSNPKLSPTAEAAFLKAQISAQNWRYFVVHGILPRLSTQSETVRAKVLDAFKILGSVCGLLLILN